jgi:Domain of unknown function (DUF4288)
MGTESTSQQESLYIALILFESSSNVPDRKPLYQECFVLIKANSLEEAKGKILVYGRGQEGSYQNENKEIITWSLKHVVDVNSVLYDLNNGTELYARHFRNYQAYCLFEPLLSGEEI